MREKEKERESEKVTRKRNDFVGRCEIEREADQSGMVGRIVRREGAYKMKVKGRRPTQR